MRQIILMFVAVMFLMVACNKNVKQGYFCDKHEVIDNPLDSLTMSGEILIPADTTTFVSAISVEGNCLYLQTVNTGEIFRVYSLDGHLLGSFGKNGNAKNEFSRGLAMNGQCMDGDVWVYDANRLALWSFNTAASLKAKSPVFKRSFLADQLSSNVFYVNDTTIVYDSETANNFCLKIVNPKTKKVKKKFDLYETPHKEAAEVYDTHSALSPDGKHLAMAMMYLNQMNFISLTDFERSSTSLYRDSKICDDESKKIFYYRGIATNDQYVCGLYSNTLLMGGGKEQKNTEIHVFDWDGNFKTKLVANDILYAIAIDNNGNVFGLDKDQNIRLYRNVLQN